MNIFFSSIRERIRGVIATVIGSALFLACGLFFTFFLAPRQAIEANRIANLPHMDAGYVQAAAPGDDLLLTGTLEGNPPVFAESNLVVYTLEEWQVTPPDPDSESTTATGKWVTVETVFPDLTLNVGGQPLTLLQRDNVRFSGPVHEELLLGDGPDTATHNNEDLPDGTLRYRGFYDGDLVTVLGTKASTGDILPETLFAGDRVAFEESEADAAKGLLIGGLVMMACAPVVLIGGGLAAVFGRRRR